MRTDESSVGQVFHGVAERDPQRVCLIQQQQEIRYGELGAQVNRLANGLAALGIQAGEKVAILLSNTPAYVISYLACATLGAVVVPVNVKFTGAEIGYVLDNSDAAALILAPEFLDCLAEMPQAVPQLREVVLLGLDTLARLRRSGPHAKASWRWHDFDHLIATNPPQPPPAPVDPDDPLGIFYTSGTTGRPKGVVLTHRQAVAGMDAWIAGLDLHAGSRSLVIAPFFHIAFNAFVCSMFRAGGSTVVFDSFRLKLLLREIERTRPTMMFAIPSVYIMMVDAPDLGACDLGSLESMVYGAAPMPVEIIHRLRALCPSKLYNAYGQTETSSAISRLASEFALSKAGSVGTPLQGVDITILDDADRPVPPGILGEICVRGVNVFQQYYKLPEQTSAKLRRGWHHTGDLGYLDEEGFLYISDRKDDLIITHGEKVFPKEIEEILFTHPDVLDAAVAGVADRVKGQVVAAFIVPRIGRQLTGPALRDFCRERLALFKVPRFVHFVGAVPRNPSGKTVRQALRQIHEEAGAAEEALV